MKAGARRGAGLAVATAGLLLTVRYLPPEMWVSLIGMVLVWAGWMLFRKE
jgi:hypothetical protein